MTPIERDVRGNCLKEIKCLTITKLLKGRYVLILPCNTQCWKTVKTDRISLSLTLMQKKELVVTPNLGVLFQHY